MRKLMLSAVILAGGESSRMGQDKAWLGFQGRPLLVHALEKLQQLPVRNIFISGRPGEDYSSLGCPVLLDLEPGFGPLGGIERALHACATPLLLVLAVDMPAMTAEFLGRMLERCDRLTGVVPHRHDRIEPLAAIYPRYCHEIAFRLCMRSRRAAAEFADSCRRARAVRTWGLSPSDAPLFANWNRPGDVTRLSPAPS